MIKTILGHLESGVEKLESGQLSPEDMELLVEDAKELYERMVIMRYKIYETNVLGVSAPVVSASIRQPEIETPIDLFGAIDLSAEPEFEVTFANEEPEVEAQTVVYPLEEDLDATLEELVENEDVLVQEDSEVLEEDASEEIIEDAPKDVEEDTSEEIIEDAPEEIEEDASEDVEEEPIQEVVTEQTFEDDSESQAHYEPQFSANQPIWMAEMEANIRDNRSVFPLETLAGAFTLNEKLQFINELFDGSSDDFSASVKQLDQLASMDAARNMLAELSQTFNWDTESEIVEDFLYKICRRHAAGA
ncbi:MAG: hypothetical protein ACKOWW_05100 [Flavobacteriales bacterium]